MVSNTLAQSRTTCFHMLISQYLNLKKQLESNIRLIVEVNEINNITIQCSKFNVLFFEKS